MELEQVISLPGIKILDTNVLQDSRQSILDMLYYFRDLSEVSLEPVFQEINFTRRFTNHLLNPDIYSISEAGQEKEFLLLRLEEKTRFLSSHRYSSPRFTGFKKIPKESVDKISHHRRATRRHNKSIETRKKLRLQESSQYTENDSFNYLNILWQDLGELIEAMKIKDVRETFSQEEARLYKRFLGYFAKMCELFPHLKRDYHFRYDDYEHKPNEFQTDEKLISAALTLTCTRRKPVILISNDSDIKRMRWFFYHNDTYQNRFGVYKPNHKFQLYSDFHEGTGFQIQ